MPTRAASDLPPGTATFIGAKGALFYVNSKGKRVYIVNSKSDIKRSFTPRRGAYLRFIENNSAIIS